MKNRLIKAITDTLGTACAILFLTWLFTAYISGWWWFGALLGCIFFSTLGDE